MRFIWSALALCVLVGTPGAARGDGAVSAGVTVRGVLEMDHINPEILWDPLREKWNFDEFGQPILDDQYPLLWAWVRGWWAPVDWLTFHGTVDPGVIQYRSASTTQDTVLYGEIPLKEYHHGWTIDGMRPEDSLQSTGLVREAAVHLDLGPEGFLEISGGKERVRVGDGWIYDDWGFSAQVRAHLSRLTAPPLVPWIGVVFPYRYWDDLEDIGSRLLTLSAGLEWRPSPFDSLTVEVSWLRDRARQVGALLTNVFIADEISQGHDLVALNLYGLEPPIETDILWIRLSGEALLGDVMLSGTLIFQYGEAHLDPVNPDQADKRIRMPAFAGGLEAILPLDGGAWIPGLFMVGVQGADGDLDLQGTSADLPVFISLVPYLHHTALLFSGGLDAALASRQSTIMGMDGRGIFATGASLAWRPSDRGSIHVTVAPAWSVGRSPWTGRRFVGVEADLRAAMELGAGFSLEVENDLLAGGSYHRGSPLIWRIIAGASWRYE